MSDAPLLVETTRGVATLTLNRPDNRNALSPELLNALADAFEAATADDAVRVIVLTAVEPAFCAGADLKAASSDVIAKVDLPGIFDLIQLGPKPVVGRISGHCTGGGVGLAAACDISIAADDVMFGFTEVRIGAAPAMISVVCLPKMRRGDALELFLSGEKVSAARAAEVGIINRAVPRDPLDAAVAGLVAKLVRGGPSALAAAKRLVFDVPDMADRATAFAETQQRSIELFTSPEAAEGLSAFREKRDPSWVPTE
ncbi:MAG: enoyl-CoA hydratase-related protein [Nitriliruptorales bacterium]|nr:enoyl-CoA hydratase-related protein [Nitriliruptorales bacterium]